MGQPASMIDTGGWCEVCCTRHADDRPCPGDLPSTGPERHGWRVHVETPEGPTTYGVLVAPSNPLWRARILTFPNTLWSVPYGFRAMKFVGRTPAEAEERAIEYIKDHCSRNGFRIEDQPAPVRSLEIHSDPTEDEGPDGTPKRKLWSVPVRFAPLSPDYVGTTVNFSHDGIFIGTALPLDIGETVEVRLNLDCGPICLRGEVVWSRTSPESGRPLGMGIRLTDPPAAYLRFFERLP